MNLLPSLAFAILLMSAAVAPAADGLISVQSPHSAKATMDRFEALVRQRGLNVFARIDHAAGAATVGRSLRPTELLIFGSPRGGTPFMECAQSVGIDLPLKALAWEDSRSRVWLSYNDPAFVARRHDVAKCPAAETLGKTLADLADAAVSDRGVTP